MNLDRTGPQDPSKYDLMAVAMHEMDEVLGLGSALPSPPSGNPFAEDLFRYNAGGRSYSAANGTQAFFSIDPKDPIKMEKIILEKIKRGSYV